jgi:hypothetical protein
MMMSLSNVNTGASPRENTIVASTTIPTPDVSSTRAKRPYPAAASAKPPAST